MQAAAKAAGLKNVIALHARAEDVEGTYDFVVSRAVTRMAGFLSWLDGKIKTDSLHPLPNGVLYLKGGDLRESCRKSRPLVSDPTGNLVCRSLFETKQVVSPTSRRLECGTSLNWGKKKRARAPSVTCKKSGNQHGVDHVRRKTDAFIQGCLRRSKKLTHLF